MSENQDGVKDYVDDRADALSDHTEDGFTRRLKESFTKDLHEYKYRSDTYDAHILVSIVGKDGVTRGLRGSVHSAEERTEHEEENVAAEHKKEALTCYFIRFFKILLSEGA